MIAAGVIVGGIWFFKEAPKSPVAPLSVEATGPHAYLAPASASASISLPSTPQSSPSPSASLSMPQSPEQVNRALFEGLTQQALRQLPTKDDIKNLPEEQIEHGTPSLVIEKIQIMGDIAQAVADHPELEPRAIEFYRTCALTPEFLNSIRARCLANLRRLAPKHGVSINLNDFPNDVRQLSEVIP